MQTLVMVVELADEVTLTELEAAVTELPGALDVRTYEYPANAVFLSEDLDGNGRWV